MRLFEAIVEANHRAARGDKEAGLRPAEFSDSLPIAALTCIDARLNPLLPEVLGIEEKDFIWLRNAGNIITGPLSSTMRSIALACAVKGAKEIVVIGHTDCQVCKTDLLRLTDRLQALGVDRSKLPENLVEFFGMFASERQNVIKACDFIRQSPIIGSKIPVHGLVVDIHSGQLEWIVNGYQTLGNMVAPIAAHEQGKQGLKLPEFKLGEMKFPEMKIGDVASAGKKWVAETGEQLIQQAEKKIEEKVIEKTSSLADRVKEEFRLKLKVEKPPEAPPAIPLPPPIQPKPNFPPRRKRQ